MRSKRHTMVYLLLLVIFCVPLLGTAQQTQPVVSQPPQEPIRDAAESAVNQALTYIDSIATYLGQGVLYVLNLITGDRVSADLQKPIGYLALITLILLLFGLLDFARRVIWIGIIVGWVLLIVRIILDALNL